MSTDGAKVRELRPSTDTMTSCRFHPLATIARGCRPATLREAV
jgi:hypothetical protein